MFEEVVGVSCCWLSGFFSDQAYSLQDYDSVRWWTNMNADGNGRYYDLTDIEGDARGLYTRRSRVGTLMGGRPAWIEFENTPAKSDGFNNKIDMFRMVANGLSRIVFNRNSYLRRHPLGHTGYSYPFTAVRTEWEADTGAGLLVMAAVVPTGRLQEQMVSAVAQPGSFTHLDNVPKAEGPCSYHSSY